MLKDLRRRIALKLLPESELVRWIGYGRYLERRSITEVVKTQRALAGTQTWVARTCDQILETIDALEQA
jgi:hypothetical protein